MRSLRRCRRGSTTPWTARSSESSPTSARSSRSTSPTPAVILRSTSSSSAASWDRDRTVGTRLVDAFNESETMFEAAQRQFPYNSPWLIADVEDAARLMGADYHAHGLEKNRHAVDVFCRSAFEDGLLKRRLTADDFFADFLKA